MTGERAGSVAWLWLGLPLLAGQALLLSGFAAGTMPTEAYLLRHLGLCLAAAGLAAVWAVPAPPGRRRDRAAASAQLLLWTLLAGPFGTLAALALLTLSVPPPAMGPSEVADEPATPLDRLERLYDAVLDGRLRRPGAHRIRPLADVIAAGRQCDKFDALNVISRRYSPQAAPLLRRALADPDGAVRVLAATIIAQQHDAHTQRIGALQAQAGVASAGFDEWAALAQARLAYAASGLLEPARAEAERDAARADMLRAERQRALAAGPDAAVPP